MEEIAQKEEQKAPNEVKIAEPIVPATPVEEVQPPSQIPTQPQETQSRAPILVLAQGIYDIPNRVRHWATNAIDQATDFLFAMNDNGQPIRDTGIKGIFTNTIRGAARIVNGLALGLPRRTKKIAKPTLGSVNAIIETPSAISHPQKTKADPSGYGSSWGKLVTGPLNSIGHIPRAFTDYLREDIGQRAIVQGLGTLPIIHGVMQFVGKSIFNNIADVPKKIVDIPTEPLNQIDEKAQMGRERFYNHLYDLTPANSDNQIEEAA